MIDGRAKLWREKMENKLYADLKEKFGSTIADKLMKDYNITPKPFVAPKMPQKYRNITDASIPLRPIAGGKAFDEIEPGGYVEAFHFETAREGIMLEARRIYPRDTWKNDPERTKDGWYLKGGEIGRILVRESDLEPVPDMPPPAASTAPEIRL